MATIRALIGAVSACVALASCATAKSRASPAVFDPAFCHADPGQVCAAVERAIDHEPVAGVRVSLVGPSGNVIASSRTNASGIALLPLPDANVPIKYVIAEPFPTTVVGVHWYPSVHQYYIESCGGSIP